MPFATHHDLNPPARPARRRRDRQAPARARLKKERDDIIEDFRAKIARAARKLRQTAVFSEVVLSEEASRTLRQLVDMLEEQGDEGPEEYLPSWTQETARIFRTLIDEAQRELAALPGLKEQRNRKPQ
jgi:hypothetical protein